MVLISYYKGKKIYNPCILKEPTTRYILEQIKDSSLWIVFSNFLVRLFIYLNSSRLPLG